MPTSLLLFAHVKLFFCLTLFWPSSSQRPDETRVAVVKNCDHHPITASFKVRTKLSHFDAFAQQARASIRYYFRLQQGVLCCFIIHYLRSIYFSLLVSASRLGTRAAAVLRHRAQNKMPNCNSILICEIRQEKTLSYVTFEKARNLSL